MSSEADLQVSIFEQYDHGRRLLVHGQCQRPRNLGFVVPRLQGLLYRLQTQKADGGIFLTRLLSKV